MKIQVTVLINLDITRSDFAIEDTSTDDDVREQLRKQIYDGDLSLDDVMEISDDYTVTVVKGEK
jgi:hypothetical protein